MNNYEGSRPDEAILRGPLASPPKGDSMQCVAVIVPVCFLDMRLVGIDALTE